LPRDKERVFDALISRWECNYAIMSIALDDAIARRSRGHLVSACQQVSVSSDLFGRLTKSLVFFCAALSTRGRHIASLPVVEPLKTEFFRGDTAQSAASWNGILHHVLFGERSRFFHKLRILSSTLDQLDFEFSETAADIASGMSTDPPACWKTLECLHYDFTTCFREAEVVLKSFMLALPLNQVANFAAEMDNPNMPKLLRARPRSRPRAFSVSA
jgi:hypothetical protein